MYLDQGKKLEASDRSGANHVGRSGLQARANEEQKREGTNKFLDRTFFSSFKLRRVFSSNHDSKLGTGISFRADWYMSYKSKVTCMHVDF